MLSQHSRFQALIKKEGCDRHDEPTLNLAILMEMKPERKPLGCNPLSDAPYRNLGMVLNEQGPGCHPRDTPCRDLGTVSSEQGSGRRILSGALYRRPGVVKNKQGSSHLSRRVRRVRKLVEPTRIRLGSWNVGSLTGKLRELVDTATGGV